MNSSDSRHASRSILRRARSHAVLLVPLLLVFHASRGAADPAASSSSTDAHERFTEAVRFFKEDQVTEALPLFEKLEAETESPNASLYVGHCLVKLGRYVDAYRAFSRTISTAVKHNDDKYEATKEAARLQLHALDLKVAKLVIALAEVRPGVRVTIDGEPLDPALIGTASILEPGEHRVEGTADGMQPIGYDVDVQAGETKTLVLALREQKAPQPMAEDAAPQRTPPPATVDGSPLKTAGFIAAGVGVVGLTVFTIAGLGAKGVRDDLAADCGERGCSDSAHRDDAARGETLQVVANTGLVVGALGVVGGGALLFLGYSSSRETGPDVALAPGGGFVSYRGAF